MSTTVAMPAGPFVPRSRGRHRPGNGGFPLPPAGEPHRIVMTTHPGCAETRVRIPVVLPAGIVHRATCDHCAEAFDITMLIDYGIEPAVIPAEAARTPAPPLASDPSPVPAPAAPVPVVPAVVVATATDPAVVTRADQSSRPNRLARLRDPNGRPWRYAAAPIAALAVIAALALLQSDGVPPAPNPFPVSANTATAAQPATVAATEPQDDVVAAAADSAQLISEPTFTLAIPRAWEASAAEGGATFAAVSPDGEADVTLWVSRDPKLDFATFQARSLAQLEQLAGSARVIDREIAPTQDGMVTTLAADAPEGAPAYQVVLRASGPYRYYLATTLAAGASARSAAAIELIQGSFTPEPAR